MVFLELKWLCQIDIFEIGKWKFNMTKQPNQDGISRAPMVVLD